MDAHARVLRLPRVQARTGLSRSTIYERVADVSCPKPVRLGVRAIGWIEVVVDEWIRQPIAAGRSDAQRPAHCVFLQPVACRTKNIWGQVTARVG